MTYTELYETRYSGQIERILSKRAFIRSRFLAALPAENRVRAEKIFGEYGSGSGAERKQVGDDLAEEYRTFFGRLYEYETATSRNMLRCLYDLPEIDTSAVVSGISGKDAALAEVLRRNIFTMEDLARLDDRSMQKILREISEEDCARAMIGADEAVQKKIFSNMSKRVAAMLQNLMNSMHPTGKEISFSRKVLIRIAVRLENAGEITDERSVHE